MPEHVYFRVGVGAKKVDVLRLPDILRLFLLLKTTPRSFEGDWQNGGQSEGTKSFISKLFNTSLPPQEAMVLVVDVGPLMAQAPPGQEAMVLVVDVGPLMAQAPPGHEAMVLVVDVGPLMAQAPPGQVTPLENAKDAISMLLQRKDEVALVLLGTAETANELAGSDDESYANITVARPLGQPDFDLLEYVKNDVVPGPVSADCILLGVL
ncbi:X-ray repair cross-complementing protein 5 [Branchiostoma belcheri]|nr:X-ray repair cross-complementing protein 5 [Branchiostoma belcheri]